MNIVSCIVCFFCGHRPYRVTWRNTSYLRMKRKGGQKRSKHIHKYHTKMKFSVYSWDGPIETPLKVGDSVEISFMVEAREAKGNWFNEVKAYNIEYK